MAWLVDLAPWLIAMLVLMFCSGFFSASEAALFYLRDRDRRVLAEGNRAQRAAAALLKDPDRLLTAVLFWNLVVNITYFTLASIAGLRMEHDPRTGDSHALAFAAGSLLALIFFSEMLPKSLAVVNPRLLSALVAPPMAVMVRLLDPLMPALRLINLLSQRLIWPSFEPEPYLEVSDLERAISLSTSDAQLLEQEQTVLQNIVGLSDLRVDELMRPRLQFRSFRPPVSLTDLQGKMTPSGYLLITEPDSEEIAGAIQLAQLTEVPREHLEHYAEPVLYIPWCTPVSEVLQQMHVRDRRVAVVVNELGESIGVVTFEDIVDSTFSPSPSRSARLLHRHPIHPVRAGVWHVTGMTSLRRMSRYFNAELPESRSQTLTGVVQEALGRLPQIGDECQWGDFHLRVVDAPARGQLVVELTLMPLQEERG